MPAPTGERQIAAGVFTPLEGAGVGVCDSYPHIPETAVHDPPGRANIKHEILLSSVEIKA